MEEYNPTPEQYAKDYFKEITWFEKVLYYLCILKFKHTRISKGKFMTQEKLNPFNPLSYITVTIGLTLSIFVVLYYSILDIIDNFKY